MKRGRCGKLCRLPTMTTQAGADPNGEEGAKCTGCTKKPPEEDKGSPQGVDHYMDFVQKFLVFLNIGDFGLSLSKMVTLV